MTTADADQPNISPARRIIERVRASPRPDLAPVSLDALDKIMRVARPGNDEEIALAEEAALEALKLVPLARAEYPVIALRALCRSINYLPPLPMRQAMAHVTDLAYDSAIEEPVQTLEALLAGYDDWQKTWHPSLAIVIAPLIRNIAPNALASNLGLAMPLLEKFSANDNPAVSRAGAARLRETEPLPPSGKGTVIPFRKT